MKCVSSCESLRCMQSYLTVRVCKHPGEDLTQPLQLHPTADQQQIQFDENVKVDVFFVNFLVLRLTWGCVGSWAAPAAPTAPPSSLTSWHWHNGSAPARQIHKHTKVCYFYIEAFQSQYNCVTELGLHKERRAATKNYFDCLFEVSLSPKEDDILRCLVLPTTQRYSVYCQGVKTPNISFY